MNHKLFSVEGSHPSLHKKSDSGFEYVVLAGKRDQEKKVAVPLFTFGQDGEVKSTANVTERFPVPEARVEELIASMTKAAPESSYLYEIRVGDSVGLVCTDREMQLSAENEG